MCMLRAVLCFGLYYTEHAVSSQSRPHPSGCQSSITVPEDMAEVKDEDLAQALKKRRSYIKSNLDTLTMKACRKLLEEDMGLPEKSLAAHKDLIQRYVDKIVAKQSDQNNGPSETASPGKRNRNDTSNDQDQKSKKRKQNRTEPEPRSASEVPARTSKVVDQAKRICKQASIKIPPSTYAKSKSLAEVEADLEELLAKYGLSLEASSHHIEKVRRKLEKERELDGLDVSNIVMGDRRARRTAAPINYAAMAAANSSDNSSSDEEQQDNDSSAEADSESQAAAGHEASDNAADSSDCASEDEAAPAARLLETSCSPQHGQKTAKSRNAVIQEESDDE